MDFSQESVITDKIETNFEYFSGSGDRSLLYF